MCVLLISNCGKGIDIEALRSTMEMLLEHLFRPSRTVMFAFGFDEEIGGYNVIILLARSHTPRSCTYEAFRDCRVHGTSGSYFWILMAQIV